jgi:hypothetical protein
MKRTAFINKRNSLKSMSEKGGNLMANSECGVRSAELREQAIFNRQIFKNHSITIPSQGLKIFSLYTPSMTNMHD